MTNKIKMYEHKRNQVFANDNLTKKVELLEKEIIAIEVETKTIMITDKQGFIKRVEHVSASEDIRTSPIEVVLPQDYKAGYYKFDKKTNKLVVDYKEKKEIELSIL